MTDQNFLPKVNLAVDTNEAADLLGFQVMVSTGGKVNPIPRTGETLLSASIKNGVSA